MPAFRGPLNSCLIAGLAGATNMKACCSCRAPQTLRCCGEFATNWRTLNTIGDVSRHFSRFHLLSLLKQSACHALRRQGACRRTARLRRSFARRTRSTSHRCSIFASRPGSPAKRANACSRDARAWRPSRPASSVRSCIRRRSPAHLGYLLREGVTREAPAIRPRRQDPDPKSLRERCFGGDVATARYELRRVSIFRTRANSLFNTLTRAPTA